eukprot:TRINITY_DN6088_c0_g1_i3.p1 TRINITY_DN6088_c0_g1~~TRINITY_DN6088_c0_g1_i3.p1  ORF type:complete len:339 (-),score=80.60 TRINITY_DN6088_c0_g1_i3:83-1099(-)
MIPSSLAPRRGDLEGRVVFEGEGVPKGDGVHRGLSLVIPKEEDFLVLLASFEGIISDFHQITQITLKYNAQLDKTFLCAALKELIHSEREIRNWCLLRKLDPLLTHWDSAIVPTLKLFVSSTKRALEGELAHISLFLVQIKEGVQELRAHYMREKEKEEETPVRKKLTRPLREKLSAPSLECQQAPKPTLTSNSIPSSGSRQKGKVKGRSHEFHSRSKVAAGPPPEGPPQETPSPTKLGPAQHGHLEPQATSPRKVDPEKPGSDGKRAGRHRTRSFVDGASRKIRSEDASTHARVHSGVEKVTLREGDPKRGLRKRTNSEFLDSKKYGIKKTSKKVLT